MAQLGRARGSLCVLRRIGEGLRVLGRIGSGGVLLARVLRWIT